METILFFLGTIAVLFVIVMAIVLIGLLRTRFAPSCPLEDASTLDENGQGADAAPSEQP